MTEDFSREVAAWLRPASIRVTQEILTARIAAIEALAESTPTQALVAAAHGLTTVEGTAAVETKLAEADPTFVFGESDLLVSVVAGAAVMAMLRADRPSVQVAHLVHSARFRGLTESVTGLGLEADRLIDRMSRSVRTRQPVKLSAGKKANVEEPELADAAAAINASVKRTDDLVGLVNRRLAQADEEIDVLWWGRSQTSYSSGEPWAKMDPAIRAITAGIELHGLIIFDPPFQGVFSVLRDTLGELDGTAELIALGVIASQTSVASNSVGPLLPISSAAQKIVELGGDKKTASSVLKHEGFNPKLAISLRDVAAQVLREFAIKDVP